MAEPGVGIQILSPTGNGPGDVIFTTKYPFAKLDTQLGIDLTANPPTGPVSFQNFSIFFNNDPPYDPTGATQILTEVARFKHGYSGHIPTWWPLFQNTNASNDVSQWTYGNETAIIKATSLTTYAQLFIQVDDTNVIIYILKSFHLGFPQANIVGFTIKLRVYLFVEPVLM